MSFCVRVYTSLATILFVATLMAHADVPQLLNYQGTLKSGTNPVTSQVSVIFAIWNAETDGDSLWSEQQTITPDANGAFATLLGSISPIPDSAFAGMAYLSVKVGSDPEMSPRHRLVSVGYAYRVGTIDGATGGELNGPVIIPDPDGDTLILDPGGLIIRGQGGDDEVSMTSAGMSVSGDGDALTVYDNNGNVRITIAVDAEGPAITFYDSPTALARVPGAIGEPKMEFRENGVTIYGPTNVDTTLRLLPTGDVIGQGRLAMGQNNVNSGNWANVLGFNNEASGDSSTVSGGHTNTASGFVSTVSGGAMNDADTAYATVGGGWGNTASGAFSVVSGGSGNTASGKHSTISGGQATVAAAQFSSVGGGFLNIADGEGSRVGGGLRNKARGNYSVVAGGGASASADSNAALSDWSTVSGGRRNIASGFVSTISGGQGNTTGQSYAVVAGGTDNAASGPNSAILGGSNNAARALNTFVLGALGNATHVGSAIISANSNLTLSDSINTGGNEQLVVRADGGVYFTNTGEVAPYDNANILTTRGGAYLSGNGTTWTNASDRNQKENFAPLDRAALLEKIAALEITRWNYIGESESVTHVGPVAQDFYALFGVGGDDKSISTIDPAGIALAAIQELHKKTQKIEELETQMAELQALVQQLLVEKQ